MTRNRQDYRAESTESQLSSSPSDRALTPTSAASPAPLSPNTQSHVDSIANTMETIDIDPEASRRPPGRPRPSGGRIRNPPHDVADEEPPRDAFHDAAFQQAYSDARTVIGNLSDVLASSTQRHEANSAIRKLSDNAAELARFQCPTTRIVGFVGDSGVGKSSLLNCLLDADQLARTSNSGEACTCVVTEFHYHPRDDYAIEVDYFTADELKSQIQRLLEGYRNYHLHENEMSGDERANKESLANEARDTFRAMFRGRLVDETFLLNDSEQDTLRTLEAWLEETRPRSNRRTDGLTRPACAEALVHLSSDSPSNSGPAVWPYIQKIQVFLNAYILSKGLVLADLPGLRDQNSARRNITERYIINCHEIFVVCNIGRAATDEGVEHVIKLARQARLSNVGIVCTKSDDINPVEAQSDYQGNREIDRQRSRELRRLNDAISSEQRQAEEFLEQVAEYYDNGGPTEEETDIVNGLNHRERQSRSRIDQLIFMRKSFLVTTRNTIVTEALRREHGHKVPNANLRVFCVSNQDYREHRNSSRDVSLPYLNLSGIIEFRRFCVSIVSQSQHLAAQHYMKDLIPGLLGQIDLWVQTNTGGGISALTPTIREALDTLESRLQSDLDPHAPSISRIGRDQERSFNQTIYAARRIANWSRRANDASLEWGSWSPSSYSAFCRKYGDHKTKIMGARNWNEEAMASMVSDLEEPWQAFLVHLQNWQDTFIFDTIETSTDWAIQYSVEHFSHLGNTAAPLRQTLAAQQNTLLYDIHIVNDKFDTDLQTLRTNALSCFRTSFFGVAVEPSYRSAIQEYGDGSHRRRVEIITGGFGRAGLFDDIMKQFRDEFRDLSRVLQQDIQSAAAAYLGRVHEAMEILRNDEALSESEMDAEYRERVRVATEVAQAESRRLLATINV